MPGPAILMLVGTAGLVAALAFYLIYVAVILKHVVGKLNVILDGVAAVSRVSQPIGGVATQINADLQAASDSLERVAAKAQDAASAAAAARADTPERPGWR